MPRTLITGGTGFLGSHLASSLTRAGHDVRTLDINPPEGADAGRYDFLQADVRDREAVFQATRGCDVVIDNAALVPVTRATPAQYEAVNVAGCGNVLDAAEAVGAYVLHISSSAIYGIPDRLPVTADTPLAPFEPYGASKADAERLVGRRRAAGLTVGSLRPRALLGAGRLGLFEVIFARIQRGRRVPLFGRGDNLLQTCDVDDFCSAAVAAVERKANAGYNIGAAEFGTVRDDLQALIERAGTGARLQPVPTWLIRAVLAPLDAVGRSPFNEWHWRAAPAAFYCEIVDAERDLDWHPRHSSVDALWNAYENYLRAADDEGLSVHRRPLEGALARLLRR